MCSLAKCIDDQVERAVTVEVDERCTGAIEFCHGDAGLVSHVCEMPIAQIAIEGVWGIETAEKEIGQPVSIDVARGNAGAVENVLVGDVAVGAEKVGSSALTSRFRVKCFTNNFAQHDERQYRDRERD